MSNEAPAVRAVQPQKAAGLRTENSAESSRESAAPVEGEAESSAPQVDKEEALVKEQEVRGPEVVEASVVQGLLPAPTPGGSGRNPVPEENDGKQEITGNEKIEQPVSQNKDEIMEKTDMPEKSFLAARNVPAEKTAADSAQEKKSEKEPDISTGKTPSAAGNKPVSVSSGQRGQGNGLTKGNMPVPARKQNEPEIEVASQAMLTSAEVRQEEQPALQLKAVPGPPTPAAPGTGKEVTAPSSPKEKTFQKLPDARVSPGPNLSAPAGKPLQDISLMRLSPGITLTATEEKSSQTGDKVETTNPPALEAKDDGIIGNPKADPVMTKQKAETAGKLEPAKAAAVSGKARMKNKAGTAEGDEDLLKKEGSPVKGNDTTTVAINGNPGVRTAQASPSAGLAVSDKKPGHKKNAGADNTSENSPEQTRQKPVASGGPLNDPLKPAHGPSAKSAEIGSQKPAMGLKAHGEENTTPIKSTGSETGKNDSTMHTASQLPLQIVPVSGGSADRPSAGAEVKLPRTLAAVEGPPHEEGAATKFGSDIKNQAQSVDGKATRSESAVLPDPGKETGKNSIGIPVSEALIQKDIKIKLVLESADMPDVLTQLFRKSHPGLRGRRNRERPELVEGIVETRLSSDTDKAGTRLFAVTKAEKGVYTLVLENKGKKALTPGVIFHFYEGRGQERRKEYKGREIMPGDLLKFVFIMPEAFFWDDEDRFSGSVEDSRSITKFHSESGLVWKEEK